MSRYIVLAMIACLSFGLRGEVQERYKLYPTQNMWTFLKLNTTTGQIRHVQYGMEQQERFEYVLNETDLATLNDKKHVRGRYKLYPTQNRWTFILLDTLDGDAFQVQWGEQCHVVAIPLGTIKRSEDAEAMERENKASKDGTAKEESTVEFLKRFL